MKKSTNIGCPSPRGMIKKSTNIGHPSPKGVIKKSTNVGHPFLKAEAAGVGFITLKGVSAMQFSLYVGVKHID